MRVTLPVPKVISVIRVVRLAINSREIGEFPMAGPLLVYTPYGVSGSLARQLPLWPDHFDYRVERTQFMGRGRKNGARNAPISRALRKTIRDRDLTAYAAAKQAGVSVDAVQRFMNSQRGLNLATVDKLADALDLTLCPDKPAENGGRE